MEYECVSKRRNQLKHSDRRDILSGRGNLDNTTAYADNQRHDLSPRISSHVKQLKYSGQIISGEKSAEVIQLSLDGLNAEYIDRFGQAVGRHAGAGARGEYQRLGGVGGQTGIQHLNELNLDMEMDEYCEELAALPPIPGIAPLAGNHLFNTLGNSLWNFYTELFANIEDDPTYRQWTEEPGMDADIARVRYGDLEVLCVSHDEERDHQVLRYYGALASNNHITYALYTTKFFIDCLHLIKDAMYGEGVGDIPEFDTDQATDQPALHAKEQAIVGHPQEQSDYYDAFNVFDRRRNDLLELFEEAISSLANYLDMKANAWFRND